MQRLKRTLWTYCLGRESAPRKARAKDVPYCLSRRRYASLGDGGYRYEESAESPAHRNPT